MKFKFSIKLAIISLIGNIIIAIGVSTCRISQMGIDPFTSMTTGISGLLNIPLGVFQGSINAVLFLVLILLIILGIFNSKSSLVKGFIILLVE